MNQAFFKYILLGYLCGAGLAMAQVSSPVEMDNLRLMEKSRYTSFMHLLQKNTGTPRPFSVTYYKLNLSFVKPGISGSVTAFCKSLLFSSMGSELHFLTHPISWTFHVSGVIIRGSFSPHLFIMRELLPPLVLEVSGKPYGRTALVGFGHWANRMEQAIGGPASIILPARQTLSISG